MEEMQKKYFLNELQPGERAQIIRFTQNNQISLRLKNMGLIPGKEVYYIKNAPFKDPMQLEIDSNNITLRHSDASMIEIKLLD